MTSPTPRGRFEGRVQIYTGDGKGKTTAALGLALRAAGRGFRTYIGQFLKGRDTGELRAVRRLAPLIVIEQFGGTAFLRSGRAPSERDRAGARRGLAACRAAARSGTYRIVVLDEIHLALHFGLLSLADVQAFLDDRPRGVEIVLTGRRAPAALVRRADLVTEMRCRKHYFDRGVRARRGIED